jgi:outer membrane receptor protein involved in Fe transport
MKTHFLLALGVVLCAESTVYGQATNDSINKYDDLAEVEIRSYVPQGDLVEIGLMGNISLNVSANDILSNSENLLDLLNKMPLLEKSGEKINVIGKEKAPVFVLDNKPMPWSSLENFPVTQIEKIELLANPSGRMLAISNGAPIINIVSKKMDTSKGNAYFVTGKLNGRYSERHQKLFPNLGFGTNWGKVSITGNYNFVAQQRKDRRDVLTEKDEFGNVLRISEGNNNFYEPQAHDFSFNLYYNPKPNHHININTNTSVHQHRNKTSAQTLETNGSLIGVNQQETVNGLPINQYIYLGYDYDIDKTKQFNTYIAYNLGQIRFKTFNLKLNEQTDLFQEKDRKSISRTNFISSNLNYKQNWRAEKFTYETGVQYKFFSSHAFGSDINTSLLEENNYVYYHDFKHKINEHINYNIGLNIDYRKSDNKKTTWEQENVNFLPKFSLNWNINSDYGLYVNYLFHVERPGFYELNPDKVSYNSINYIVGNPSLKSEKVQDLDMSVKLYKIFYLTLTYYNAKDEIFNYLLLDKSNKDYYIGYMNGDMQRLTLNLNINKQIKFYQFQVNISASSLWADNSYHVENVAFLNNGKIGFAFKTNQTFVLPNNFKIGVLYNFVFRKYSSIYSYKPTHELECSISKSFLNNKISTSFVVANILYNYNWYDYSVFSQHIQADFRERRIWKDIAFRVQLGFNLGSSFSNERHRKDKDIRNVAL